MQQNATKPSNSEITLHWWCHVAEHKVQLHCLLRHTEAHLRGAAKCNKPCNGASRQIKSTILCVNMPTLCTASLGTLKRTCGCNSMQQCQQETLTLQKQAKHVSCWQQCQQEMVTLHQRLDIITGRCSGHWFHHDHRCECRISDLCMKQCREYERSSYPCKQATGT